MIKKYLCEFCHKIKPLDEFVLIKQVNGFDPVIDRELVKYNVSQVDIERTGTRMNMCKLCDQKNSSNENYFENYL